MRCFPTALIDIHWVCCKVLPDSGTFYPDIDFSLCLKKSPYFRCETRALRHPVSVGPLHAIACELLIRFKQNLLQKLRQVFSILPCCQILLGQKSRSQGYVVHKIFFSRYPSTGLMDFHRVCCKAFTNSGDILPGSTLYRKILIRPKVMVTNSCSTGKRFSRYFRKDRNEQEIDWKRNRMALAFILHVFLCLLLH